MFMTPALLMLSGSLLARSAFWLTETDGALPPPPASPLNELEPQALKASAATEAATTPSLIRTFICAAPSQPRSFVSLGLIFAFFTAFVSGRLGSRGQSESLHALPGFDRCLAVWNPI